jgi:phospholipid/cholesterol/gamma-HCH transport system permease protein
MKVAMQKIYEYLEETGRMAYFAYRFFRQAFSRPFEFKEFFRQCFK